MFAGVMTPTPLMIIVGWASVGWLGLACTRDPSVSESVVLSVIETGGTVVVGMEIVGVAMATISVVEEDDRLTPSKLNISDRYASVSGMSLYIQGS